MRRSYDARYMQLIRTVATVNRLLMIVEYAVTPNRLTVPLERVALYEFPILHAVELPRFLEIRTTYLVAPFYQCDRVIDHCRFGIGLAFPFDRAAEILRLHRPFHRSNRQNQLIDTVLSGAGLMLVQITVGSRYAAQAAQTMPTEIIALADRHALYEMITRLVLGQD